MTGIQPLSELAEQAANDRIAAIAERLRPSSGSPTGGISFGALLARAEAADPVRQPARTDGRISTEATVSATASSLFGGSTGGGSLTGAVSDLLAGAGGGSSLSAILGRGGPGQAVIDEGMTHLGVPYLWGGTDPEKGFDCSGLVQDAYRRIGVEMPKWSRHQAKMGVEVPSLDEAIPGDVVAFGDPVSHVGLYVGDGKMLHAPRTGEVVKVEEINRPIATIRRIVTPQGTSLAAPLQTEQGAAGAAVANSPAAFRALFEAAGERHGVDPDLLAAVARTESNFDVDAVSPVGAQGLMQFMPATAAEMGVDPWDPASAIDGAARYLATSIEQFDTIEEAIASYNAGRGAVRRHGGVPPFAETENYVDKVLAAWGGR
ncbi:MAG: transglycosylase SLT domain-containing protein [Actinomycetota bacterium]